MSPPEPPQPATDTGHPAPSLMAAASTVLDRPSQAAARAAPGRWRRAALTARDRRPSLRFVAYTLLAVLGVVLFLGLAGYTTWSLPLAWYGSAPAPRSADAPSPDAYLQAVSGLRTALLTGFAALLAGLTALLGLTYNARNLRVAREALAASRRAQDENLRVQVEGQVTERYTRAVEQLGDDEEKRVTVRLGGVYALERIAHDSARDAATVFDVLGAFVRERARYRPSDEQWYAWDAEYGFPDPDPEDLEHLEDLPQDVQAALTVLGRMPFDASSEAERLTLAPAFRERMLDRADLSGATLPSIVLSRAILRRSRLNDAHLEDARLDEAILSGADLSHAHLEWAVLDRANLWLANMEFAHLTDASLRDVDLREARLRGATLTRAVLTGARIPDVELMGVNLRGSDLSAIFKATDAVFAGADLTGARLHGSDLSRVKGLTQEQVDNAEGDEDTRLPAGLTVPPGWRDPT